MLVAAFAVALLVGSPVGTPAAPGETVAPSEAIRAGAAAFRGRDDPRQLAEAIARYRDAVRLHASDPAGWLGLARAEAFRAISNDADAMAAWSECTRAAETALRVQVPAFREAVDRGEDAARASGEVDARGAEALYWLSLGTMGFAQARGISAMLSVRAQVRAMMERVAQLDERIDHGGPPRALGTWLAGLPSAAGGGAAAARTHFERARTIAPEYQLTRVQEAQTLSVLLQDRAAFEARLAEVLSFDAARAPDIAPENRLAQRRARSLLARRDRLF